MTSRPMFATNNCRSAGRLPGLFLLGLLPLLTNGCADMAALIPGLSPTDPATLGATASFETQTTDLSPATWPDANWWQALNDSQLNALINEGLQTSPDLAAADARTRQASAFALTAKANLGPKVDSLATVQGMYIPETVASDSLGGSFLTFKALGLNASYNPDLWGGERAAWAAAFGLQRATEIDANASRLALSVDIARTYAQLGYGFLLQDLAKNEVKRAKQLLSLARQRVKAGIDNLAQQRQAEAAYASARQRLLHTDNLIDNNRIALAVLVGKGPDRSISIERPTALEPLTLGVPDNLPAELLGRRPDIVAAKWRVEAASRHIDSARAEFYPSFNLAAAFGLMALHTDDLLSLRSRFYTIAPAISLPVFDSGRLRANLAERNADYDLAVANYNKTLVAAFNQVAALVQTASSLTRQAEAQQEAVDAANESWQLAMERYRSGIGNYVEALYFEQQLIAAEQTLAAIHADQLDTSVQLVEALGGGYRQEPTQEPTAQTTGLAP